ncbi:hypothetical protein B0H14DRAFT_2577085 [Mycena olivaceomarginata]|nr:hypothetical protein B0H14DRAFT_2577085 [Mycena olivaceomarginata]
MCSYYNWGIPDVDVPVPPTLPGGGPLRVPIAWNRLKFPLGLYDLRHHLSAHPRAPRLFQQYRNHFLTSDIAWFAGRLSTNGAHTPGGAGFFPEFDAMRNTLPAGPAGNEARRTLNEQMQHAVFDMATLWDRTFGGTTMLFLEAVGIPTVMQWKKNAWAKRAGERWGWSGSGNVQCLHAKCVALEAPENGNQNWRVEREDAISINLEMSEDGMFKRKNSSRHLTGGKPRITSLMATANDWRLSLLRKELRASS